MGSSTTAQERRQAGGRPRSRPAASLQVCGDLIRINACGPPPVLHGSAMSMRASPGQRSSHTGPAGAWGRVVLLCLLVVIGGVFDFRHDAPSHGVPTAARTIPVTEAAQSVEDRGDTGAGRLASCHAIGACVFLAVPAPALPAPVKESGERQIEPTPIRVSRSVGGLFRPPRFSPNA